MKPLMIEHGRETPKVVMDKECGVFFIEGISIPENVSSFYKPVIEWIEEYTKSPNDETVFHIKLKYCNTSSYKVLLKILMSLDDLYKNKHNVLIKWYYSEEEEFLGSTKWYKDYFSMPYEMVPFTA